MNRPATPARPAALVLVAAAGSFTANLDLAIVNLALPTIGRAFDATQSELAWAVSAYVLPYAVSILAVGRLGDGFGHRRVLLAGALLFGLGSAISAIAPGYAVLLLGRVLQGIGGSALLTIGLALISANFVGADRARGLGIYFAAGALAAVLGPVAGGLLAESVGWQGIFLSQIPLAAAVAYAARTVLDARPGGRRRSLDWPGLVLGTVLLGGINVALLQANAWGWSSAPILGAWLTALVALVAFVARERVAAEPAVSLGIFRSRVYVASALVGAAAWFAILSGSIQLAIYLQTVRGLTAVEAAFVILPWPLAAGLLFPRAGAIVARIGPERTMVASLVLSVITAAVMATFDGSTPLPLVGLVAAAHGTPIALGVVASTVCALAEFPPEQAGIASGVFNSLRQVGSALGVAIPAAVSDLVTGGTAVGASVQAGATAALASRAVVFALVLIPVIVLLAVSHRVAQRPAGEAAGA